MLRETWRKHILRRFNYSLFRWWLTKDKKHVQKAPLTKNHIFLCIHHLMGPGEGLTQTSHVLRHEQTVVSPAEGSTEKRHR